MTEDGGVGTESERKDIPKQGSDGISPVTVHLGCASD